MKYLAENNDYHLFLLCLGKYNVIIYCKAMQKAVCEDCKMFPKMLRRSLSHGFTNHVFMQ